MELGVVVDPVSMDHSRLVGIYEGTALQERQGRELRIVDGIAHGQRIYELCRSVASPAKFRADLGTGCPINDPSELTGGSIGLS